MVMPFGKHKGRLVEDLPLDYLIWIQRNVELKANLAWAVQAAIDLKRGSYYAAPPLTDHVCGIKTIFRVLAMKYHPDVGGNVVAMQALNEFHEKLNELFSKQGVPL